MSAMTMSPACVSAGGSTSGSFGAPSVTVIAASIGVADRARASRRRGRTADRSATTGMPEALTSATTVSSSPLSGALQAGAEDRVDDERRSSEISEKCSSHAWLSAISTTVRPRRPRISRLVRASPRTSATRPIRNTDDVDAALQQRARDDEAVAAVVAAAAQHARPGARAGRRSVGLDAPRRPGGRRSPSARATECRCRRSSGDRLRASARRSARACVESSASPLVPDCGRRAAIVPRSVAARWYARRCMSGDGQRQRAHRRRSEHAVISVFDHGFLYGEGVYETLRTYNGQPFLFDRHMRRLRASAGDARARRAARPTREIARAVRETMRAAGLGAGGPRGVHPDPA